MAYPLESGEVMVEYCISGRNCMYQIDIILMMKKSQKFPVFVRLQKGTSRAWLDPEM